ncbi:hypothetical protein V8F33_009048 [Rhypophila sp. PSN 637]
MPFGQFQKYPIRIVGTPTRAMNSHLDSFIGTHETTADSGFASSLTSLVSALFSKRAKFKHHIIADRVLTSVLDNSDSWFKEATKLPATQSWEDLDEGWVREASGDSVFLVRQSDEL